MPSADSFLDQYAPAAPPSADAFLDQYAQQPSTTGDVARTVGSNLADVAAGFPMVVGNTVNGLFAGPQYLGRGVEEGVDGLLGIQPQPHGDVWQPFLSSADVVQKAGLDYQPKTQGDCAMMGNLV